MHTKILFTCMLREFQDPVFRSVYLEQNVRAHLL